MYELLEAYLGCEIYSVESCNNEDDGEQSYLVGNVTSSGTNYREVTVSELLSFMWEQQNHGN